MLVGDAELGRACQRRFRGGRASPDSGWKRAVNCRRGRPEHDRGCAVFLGELEATRAGDGDAIGRGQRIADKRGRLDWNRASGLR